MKLGTKSNRSTSTFVVVCLIFHELLPIAIHEELYGTSNYSYSLFEKCREILVADLNLLGSVGGGTCISLAILSVCLLNMIVSNILEHIQCEFPTDLL